jgi:hypothetical protein
MFGTFEPRLHQTFPSLVDDWVLIRDAPEQLPKYLKLEIPEGQRYRPGFLAWGALQWHTLGAPRGTLGPRFWGLLRAALLVVGVTLLTSLAVGTAGGAPSRPDARWLLVIGVPLAALTAPLLAIDLARYGPQEPLMVACMGLGAVLLVHAADALFRPMPVRIASIAALVTGLVLWTFGVFQKETSICILVLGPFLIPTLRAQRPRWLRLCRRRRMLLGLAGAGVLLPLVPMVVRTMQLALADVRFYGEIAAQQSFPQRLSHQLADADEALDSRFPVMVAVATVLLLAVTLFRARVDWLSVGFVVVALTFVLFAAATGVVASRYYLPSIVLTAIALARMSTQFGRWAIVAIGVTLILIGSSQAHDARGSVQEWVVVERAREALVREAAAREAGGCEVDVTGVNVELVVALPVLAPLAGEPARGCAPGERFVVLIDRDAPGETRPDDPVLAPCAPEPEPVFTSRAGEILRCTT